MVEVSYGCQAAGTNHSTILPLDASTSLTQLLPNCRYVIRYQSDSCVLTTPPGPSESNPFVSEGESSSGATM